MENKRASMLAVLVVAVVVMGLVLMTQSMAASSPGKDSGLAVGPGEVASAVAATAWSSGWIPVNQGQSRTLQHNLGGDPDDYGVELWFRDTSGQSGINRRGYGGLEWNNNRVGAYWHHLTTNMISVSRLADDTAADEILVRVWEVPTSPDYDSGWTSINAGQTHTFNHNLGIVAEDLTVGLWFSGPTVGIHHRGFGGMVVDSPLELRGASWHNLTDNSVQVTRGADDAGVERVRVVVVEGDPPDYDSGWQPVSAGGFVVLPHSLSWNPTLLLVRGECYDQPPFPLQLGIHQVSAGGSHHPVFGWQGAHLQNLTSNSIEVVRGSDDLICAQVRVRIWQRGFRVHLPMITRNQ